MERMILKSMDHIVKVFGNVSTAPKLNFKLQFIGFKCISTPSVDEICNQYCSVLNLVSNYIVLYYHNITLIHKCKQCWRLLFLITKTL